MPAKQDPDTTPKSRPSSDKKAKSTSRSKGQGSITPSSTPKSTKASPILWTSCSKSKVLYHTRNEEEHQEWLAGGYQDEALRHVVVNCETKTIKGRLSPVKRFDDSLGKWSGLPTNVLLRTLFLPEDLMKVSGFNFGCDVMITSALGIRCLFQVLPHNVKEKSELIFANQSITDCISDHVISICKIEFGSSLPRAKQVVISISEDICLSGIDNDKLSEFIMTSQHDKIVCKTCTVFISFYGRTIQLNVKEAESENCDSLDDVVKQMKNVSLGHPKAYSALCVVDRKFTILTVTRNKEENGDETDEIGCTKLGGLDDEMLKIEKNLFFLLETDSNSTLRHRAGGILIWGFSGTGKTSFGRKIGSALGVKSLYKSASELRSKYLGESESNLRTLFAKAENSQPCVMFIDDLECLGDKTDQDNRMLSSLATLIDDVVRRQLKVGVVAATNRIDKIDQLLRRSGRLEVEVEFGVPTKDKRGEILEALQEERKFKDHPFCLNKNELEQVASMTHGFVGADLRSVFTEAVTSFEGHKKPLDQILECLKLVKPSAMKEVLIEVPKVTWMDIGGLEDLKLSLKQAVEWPLKKPEVFERFGVKPPKGILMYGPPGCSKTMIAKALANESGVNFLAIKGPELFSKWVGESERAVRELFRKARQVSPAIIFFDEIDALGSERSGSDAGSGTRVGDRVLAQLLTEMDGIEELRQVTIVAATNRPDMIDKALMRPGRLDRLFYVSLPDGVTRSKVLEVHTREKPLGADVDLQEIVARTEGYSGAEIASVCNEAALKALEENIDAQEIQMQHFLDALAIVKPRIDAKLIEIYDTFRKSRQTK